MNKKMSLINILILLLSGYLIITFALYFFQRNLLYYPSVDNYSGEELDVSVESPEQAKKIVEIMENGVKLEIPNKVDYESGKNWGSIND